MASAETDPHFWSGIISFIPLQTIYAEIEQRTTSCMTDQPEWPCRRGCDMCCRQLANVPEMTRSEWELVEEGLAGLSSAEIDTITSKMTALIGHEPDSGHLICPLLNEAKGACRIYSARPAACRMYGFYVTRAGNQWCSDIQALDDAGVLDGIMLGNGSAVNRQLAKQFGQRHSLTSWFFAEVADDL